MKKLTMGVLFFSFLIIASCKKETTAPQESSSIKEVQVLSAPYFLPNFQTSGKFELAVIAIAENGDVINFSTQSASFTVDSVSNGSGYKINPVNVNFMTPQKSKVSVGILLDASGSMSWNDPYEKRKDASKELIRRLRNDNTAHLSAVADFADYYFNLLQDYTQVSDTQNLFTAIDSVGASGSTALYSGVRVFIEHTDTTVSSADYSRNILALTDGRDNSSAFEDSLGAVIDISKTKGIPVFVIGLGSDVATDSLQRLANETGGIYANADSANALDRIFSALGLGLTKGYSKITAQFNNVPASGTFVIATVKISYGGKTASAKFSFWIP